MDKLLDIVNAFAQHPQLQSLTLPQLMEFLTRVSTLKRSILLAKRAGEPTDLPPDILPRLVQRFLAESIGIDIGAIPDAWVLLKEYAWVMPTLSAFTEKENAAFHAHGWNMGLSEFYIQLRLRLVLITTLAGLTLFPPSDCCLSENCVGRNKELKTVESRKVVIYMADGAYPGHSIHLICARESL